MENQIEYSSNINIDEISQKLASKCVDAIENGIRPLTELNDYFVNEHKDLPLGLAISYAVAYNRLVRRINLAIERYKDDVVSLPKTSFNFNQNNGAQNV